MRSFFFFTLLSILCSCKTGLEYSSESDSANINQTPSADLTNFYPCKIPLQEFEQILNRNKSTPIKLQVAQDSDVDGNMNDVTEFTINSRHCVISEIMSGDGLPDSLTISLIKHDNDYFYDQIIKSADNNSNGYSHFPFIKSNYGYHAVRIYDHSPVIILISKYEYIQLQASGIGIDEEKETKLQDLVNVVMNSFVNR